MNLAVPELQEFRLEQLSVCAFFDGDNDFLSIWEKDEVGVYLSRDTSYGEYVVRMVIQAETGEFSHGHLHFDIGRPESFDNYQSLEQVSQDQLNEHLAQLEEIDLDVHIGSESLLPRDELPQRGMIKTLLGVSTESCGSRLVMTGSTMEIEGDLFRLLRWNFREETGMIDAKLSAETETTLDDAYLIHAASLMREGVECFVLETEERLLVNATNRTSSTATVRKA